MQENAFYMGTGAPWVMQIFLRECEIRNLRMRKPQERSSSRNDMHRGQESIVRVGNAVEGGGREAMQEDDENDECNRRKENVRERQSIM